MSRLSPFFNPVYFTCTIIAFSCLTGFAQDTNSSQLDVQMETLKEKYASALANLDSKAISQYEALKTIYGKTGNLDGAIWAANQIAMLKGEPPISGGNPDAFPATNPIEAERGAGQKRLADVYVGEARKIYQVEVSRLEEETKRLTRAGELDAAQAMLQRAERLSNSLPAAPPIAGSGNVPAEIAEKTFTFGGSRYYVFPESMSHAEAVKATKEIGGSILSIASEEEYNHFHSYSTENGKPLWIDLQDEKEDLDWRHASGEKASYVRWQSGEPNGGDTQKHVMIGYSGSWDMRDVNPDDRFYVICEW